MQDIIKSKVESLMKKFGFSTNRYFVDALYVATYENKKQAGSNKNFQWVEISSPNRNLAHVGDRFLKLVLAEEAYKITASLEFANDLTVKKENNKYLASLRIVKAPDGYCIKDNVAIENTKNNNVILATLIEAIIGALYLDEFERTGTSDIARKFIREYILQQSYKQPK